MYPKVSNSASITGAISKLEMLQKVPLVLVVDFKQVQIFEEFALPNRRRNGWKDRI